MTTGKSSTRGMSKAEFVRLARFRRALRQFLRFSEVAAREAGLTPQQHQMLLAIKGTPDRDWATIGELAEALQLHHNAVVQLVDRAAELGLVARTQDERDHRVTRVALTAQGERTLRTLTAEHRDELRRLRDDLSTLLAHLAEEGDAAE
ncbi:MAG TPA: MarR family transcriptional regulator [Ktedonobacterales bacterium]|nr:MarR family transcriptional regulator [Ktedonobacterales bacterium]